MPEVGEPVWPADPVARLAAERSLPRWLAQLWHDELGLQADALARAMNAAGPVALRANLLKTTRERLIQDLEADGIGAFAGAHSPWAAIVQGRANLFGSRLWRAGHFEVQDEGSQLVAWRCAALPGEKVVDFCAGAGGKTLALAAAMENRGELWALDVEGRRLEQLAARVERAGVACARWMRIESGSAPEAAAGADCVLVDAPCSALGTLRRSPDARWRISPEQVAEFPARQLEILHCASRLVRPGGRLIYATCTLHAAENRGVIGRFLAVAPEFRLDGVPLEVAPDTHGTDGFFAVETRRAGPASANGAHTNSEDKLSPE
jgi:16S rRNA (cytosine967-C5)-methyltransferase